MTHKYGCNSLVTPMNKQHEKVFSSKSNKVSWPYIFTRTCQYDRRTTDKQCQGCRGLKE